jgi:lipopolysaccharide/colanic/teichoic acid biosynthesis glycosyltransferase
LGRVNDLKRIADEEGLERVLCTNHSIIDRRACQHLVCQECRQQELCRNHSIMDYALSRQFCQLRYSGVTVMPLISVFEEICQCVPVEMVTPEWLLSASGEPRMFYIKKLKRAFDIIVSLAGLLFLWPFLLFGMILVKITSPQGPVFYRQTRSGRFGHAFTLLKLRTMRPDAETGDTAVWASTKDPRAVPGGNFLRRYRVDEIPQMWNVLRGEMSFVGPRPERPEFVEMLAEQIPFYRERLLIQPGITGWAQVNHPYAASVADARHKLEYDLYYAKNMSLFLDMFILLDTVRIILRGGVKKSSAANLLQQRVARREQAASEAKLGLPATAGVHHWMV